MRTPSALSAAVLIAITVASLTACSSPAPPPPTGGGKKVDEATAGAVAGKVKLAGNPPKPETVRMSSDQACVQVSGERSPSDAVVVSGDGAVQNAFVYIKDGVDPAYSFDIPTTAVVLDQKGCRYVPRVVGVRAGQPIEIVNSDATLHNVHALPMTNQEFNQGMKEKDPNLRHTFTVPEVMVRFKCDVHGWMNAHVGVMANPFFAVTGADGSFDIKGLPPGNYTLAVWHETLGESWQSITIADRERKTVEFAFKQ
jgi:plastocyanin